MNTTGAILVTGGAGFIGSHMADRLLGTGSRVVVFDNFNDFYPPAIKERNVAPNLDHPGYRLVRGDLTDRAALEALFAEEHFDAVVHLAALGGVRPSIADPARYVQTNLLGTTHLLEAMKCAEVKKLLFASSSSVYGNCREMVFSETLDVSQPISPYAATKSAGEQLCHVYSKLCGMSVVALRFFTVYGPRQRPDLAIAKFCRLIREGKPIPVYGDGTTERDYTYIDDIIDGLVAALEYHDTPFEIINLGGGEPVTLSRMIEVVEEALRRKAVIVRKPPQPGDVVKTAADIGKARELLGYFPRVTFREGVRNYVRYLEGIEN